jgi:hypothetical protein
MRSTFISGMTLVAIAASALPACGAERFAKEQLGEFQGERGVVELVLDQGYADTATVLRDASRAISSAAREGSHFAAWILNGSSAGASLMVKPSDAAGGGDFSPSGHNAAAWADEAHAFAMAATHDVAAALETAPPRRPGADLLGALERARAVAALESSDGPRVVVLVTGGGVHRNERLDMVSLTDGEVVTLARHWADELGDPSGLAFVLVGVGRFPDTNPPVAADFATRVVGFWKSFCDELETRGARTCVAGQDLQRDLYSILKEDS